jgi:hypothetical protein
MEILCDQPLTATVLLQLTVILVTVPASPLYVAVGHTVNTTSSSCLLLHVYSLLQKGVHCATGDNAVSYFICVTMETCSPCCLHSSDLSLPVPLCWLTAIMSQTNKNKQTPRPLVRERTIPPLVDEI